MKRLAGTCHTLARREIQQHYLLRLLSKCCGRLLFQRNRRAPESCNYLKALAARALLNYLSM